MRPLVLLVATGALLTSALSTVGFGVEQRPAVSRPNVVVIMADDLGYGDLSCYGAKSIETPHIDSLAHSGIRFTSGYCSASTCTPTRYSLLTGTFAFRQKGTGVAPPDSPALVQPGALTLPSIFQKGGYKTAVIGKWHLGLGPNAGAEPGPQWNGEINPSPNHIGFDHSFILPTTNDRVPQVYVRNSHVVNLDPKDPLWIGSKKPSEDHPTGVTHRSTLRMDWSHGHNQTIHNGIGRIGFYTGGIRARFRDEDLADAWAKENQEWIASVGEQPFFLFFASHDIHVPRMVHERFQGKSGLGPRGDAILELDWNVGQLLSTLEKLDKRDNTIVIFCSDNGPVLDDGYKDDAIEKLGDHKPAGPFLGGKYNVCEGGTRTPFLVSWPSQVPKRVVSDALVTTTDFAASFAAMLDIPLPNDACLDSQNVLDALLGKEGAKGRDWVLQQDNGSSGNFGLRSGKWKLMRHASGKATNVHLRLVPSNMKRLQLFDLESDPGESKDLSEQHPDRTQQLDQKLTEIIQAGRSRL
ncbi:Arylsulfatase [Pirellula sp. SH-Sr6A]|uniref:sulfatase family protein n=1 Tax=Pirellula sp. SH-Sr6A TaxID=1632865 RepID=UPI00078E1ECA|nr:arylsulfatase [Pirellula sp. SH-Sr6A]AMV31046.1 Arylsulfatase [Pirellula sp. SH-Sr6A]